MTLPSRPDTPFDQRFFVGIFPGGIVYADRHREQYGDYKRLAFLPYDTLCLKIQKDCPKDLLAQIQADGAKLQSRRGECSVSLPVGRPFVSDK